MYEWAECDNRGEYENRGVHSGNSISFELWPDWHVLQGAITERENHFSGKKENKVQHRAAMTSLKMVAHGIHALQPDGTRRWVDGTAEAIPMLDDFINRAAHICNVIYTPGAARYLQSHMPSKATPCALPAGARPTPGMG